VDNFFSIVLEHTESHVIRKLCLKRVCKDGIDIDYNFYHQMKGERAVWKQVIIDQMFTIYFLRRMNKKDPNRPLDSNPSKQYAKQIFTQMKMKGIDYDMTKDFNGQGQFHLVVAAKWAEYKAADKDFATKKNAAQIYENTDEKFQTALENKTLNPYEIYHDMVTVCVYMLGRYCLFRGWKEITYVQWDQISFGTFQDGPTEGRNFCKVKYPEFDKTTLFSFAHPVTRTGDKTFVYVREQEGNEFDPYKMFKRLRDCCPPEQKRVFAYPAGKDLLTKYKPAKERYLSSPRKNMGENTIGKTMKQIAEMCEFENWENFTNYAGRALGITMMLEAGGNDMNIARQSRHAGPQSMAPYKRNTINMESDVQDNLMGSCLSDRFKESTNKKLPTKNPPPQETEYRYTSGTVVPQETASGTASGRGAIDQETV
jgi:hypothetical protein